MTNTLIAQSDRTCDAGVAASEEGLHRAPGVAPGSGCGGHSLHTWLYPRQSSATHESGGAKVDWTRVEQQAPTDEQGNKVYRFSDIHCHMHNYSGRGHRPEDVVEAAIKLGIKRFTWMPIPTTLISVAGDQRRLELYKLSHHCGEHYYLPSTMAHLEKLSPEMLEKVQTTIELAVDRSIDDKLMHQISNALVEGRILPAHLDMIDLGMTGIHLGDPRAAHDILDKLWRVGRENQRLQAALAGVIGGTDHAIKRPRLRFTHVGEVTLHKELVETLFAGKSQADLKKNIAPCREAMRLAGVIGMPWLLHCDVDKPESLKSPHEKNKPPVHLEDIKALMRSCPNTEIIWAHAGGLGRFVKAGPRHLAELRKLMRDPTLAHVKLDLSWSCAANQINQDARTVRSWAHFLCEFDDRIVFGSDALTPQTYRGWTVTHDIYSEKLLPEMQKIKPGAVQRILLDNYDKIMLTARDRVDAFIDHVLPEIIDDVHHLAGMQNVDVRAIQRMRDRIYAQRQHQDGRLPDVVDYFRRIETALPPVEPGDKPRACAASEPDCPVGPCDVA